jgi:hypothetical protein
VYVCACVCVRARVSVLVTAGRCVRACVCVCVFLSTVLCAHGCALTIVAMDFQDKEAQEARDMEIQREQDEEATGDHENDSSTFADYTPKALDGISALMKHPDPVIETSTLSGIDLPKATFKLRLPFQTLLEGRITSLQYETILYACQQHEQILPEGSRC